MIANVLTVSRIVLALILFTLSPGTMAFYLVYVAAGVTDMLDGYLARKLGTESELGSKLDTMADITLVAVCMYKFIPVLPLETWMYIWAGVIVLIKIINVISGFVVEKRFVEVHSHLNKIAGLMLFLWPLTVNIKYSIWPVCLVCTIAAIEEGHLIRSKERQDETKKCVNRS